MRFIERTVGVGGSVAYPDTRSLATTQHSPSTIRRIAQAVFSVLSRIWNRGGSSNTLSLSRDHDVAVAIAPSPPISPVGMDDFIRAAYLPDHKEVERILTSSGGRRVTSAQLGEALKIARRFNRLETVRVLLRYVERIPEDDLGFSLRRAVDSNQLEMVQQLLVHVARISPTDLEKSLHIAITENHPEIAGALLQHAARFPTTDRFEEVPVPAELTSHSAVDPSFVEHYRAAFLDKRNDLITRETIV